MQERLRDLHFSDLRSCYLLLGECTELGRSPEGWTQHLHETLSVLCGVQLSVVVEGSAGLVLGRASATRDDHLLSYGWPSGESNRNAQAFARMIEHLDDPCWPTWGATGGCHVTRRRCELATDRDWYNSETYNTFYVMSNSDDVAFSRIPLPSNRHLLLQFWRERGEKPFSRRDAQRFHLISGEIANLAAENRLLTPEAALNSNLNPRLREVLRLIGRGLTEKEIAAALDLSRHTVHDYVKVLHNKLKVNSRGELVAAALQILSPSNSTNSTNGSKNGDDQRQNE